MTAAMMRNCTGAMFGINILCVFFISGVNRG